MAALPTPHSWCTMWAPYYCCCCYKCLHGCLPVPHSCCTPPYCCCCYLHVLHGCLPTPHRWCTLWAPIAAAANISYMAALPIPHRCCTHVGSLPLPLLLRLSFLHGCLPAPHSWCTLWVTIAACSYRHLHGCITYPT